MKNSLKTKQSGRLENSRDRDTAGKNPIEKNRSRENRQAGDDSDKNILKREKSSPGRDRSQDGNPGHAIQEDRPNRADYHHGSTTQGGSDFGQGSLQLGKNANKQGSESNEGSDYRSEQGWNNEELRKGDE